MEKTLFLPDTPAINRGCESLAEVGYEPKVVAIKDLVEVNDLLDDEDLNSYHKSLWDNKEAKEFIIDPLKSANWRFSDVPYAVKKVNGQIILADGRHRCRAALNSGYTHVELMVLDEKKHPEIFKDNLDEAVEYHDTLNPAIWNEDNELIPEVKEKILDIANFFIERVEKDGIKLDVKDIWLLGSNANYNYNEASDLDIHLMADESFDCDDKHMSIIYQAYKSIFNSKYDIKINGINVELYVENIDKSTNVATGIYSLNTGWIKDPTEMETPNIDQEAVAEGFNEWELKYKELLNNPTIEDIDEYIDSIYELRQSSITNEGEFGTGNLIFKEIRRFGILQELKDLKVELESKELSLN